MKISVKVKPNSKVERIENIPQDKRTSTSHKTENYKIWVKEKPEDGEANDAVIRVLAKYFGVKKSDIRLVIGGKSSQKVFEINVSLEGIKR